MAGRVASCFSSPSLLRTLVSHVRVAVRLLREPAVPLLTKMVPALAALYFISPIDVVPDFFPVVGQLDDIGLIIAAVELFLVLSPARAVDFHRSALAQGRRYSPMPAGGDIIDAEFRREENAR